MSKITKRCCVPSCDDRVSARHRFPLEKNCFHMWLKAVNNPKLKELTAERIYKSYYVCHKHFSEGDTVVGTKRGLTKRAVPSLFLSGASFSGSTDEPNLPKRIRFSSFEESINSLGRPQMSGSLVQHLPLKGKETEDYHHMGHDNFIKWAETQYCPIYHQSQFLSLTMHHTTIYP